jgi:hypothetical protein
MSGERSYVVDELRRVNCLHFCVYTCHLGQCQIMLGVLRDSTLGLGVAGSESCVEDVILFILAVSFSDLVEYQDGITDGVKDLLALRRHDIKSQENYPRAACGQCLRYCLPFGIWKTSHVILVLVLEKGDPQGRRGGFGTLTVLTSI